MFGENDRPETSEAQPIEQEQLDSDNVARRRVMEFKENVLNCEHSMDAQVEEAAVDRSARLMERWEETKDPVARKYLLEGVGREMMAIHEAPPGPLQPKEMAPNELGAYTDEGFRTDLNEGQLREDDPRDALKTYLHEYRHAEQHYEVQKSHGFAWQSVDPERSSAVEYNQDHYIEPPEDNQPGAENIQAAYERQLVETDANRFAATTTDEILERRDELRESGARDSFVTSDADAIAHRRLTAARGSGT